MHPECIGEVQSGSNFCFLTSHANPTPLKSNASSPSSSSSILRNPILFSNPCPSKSSVRNRWSSDADTPKYRQLWQALRLMDSFVVSPECSGHLLHLCSEVIYTICTDCVLKIESSEPPYKRVNIVLYWDVRGSVIVTGRLDHRIPI